MKYSIIIDECREEEVLIYAKSRHTTVERLEAVLNEDNAELFGYKDGEIVRIAADDIFCVTVEDGQVFAVTDSEKLKIKFRLYQLEELLGEGFVKINQSCIVRVSAIARFESSFSGSLKVILKNGFKDYISRRQLKQVKERVGI